MKIKEGFNAITAGTGFQKQEYGLEESRVSVT